MRFTGRGCEVVVIYVEHWFVLGCFGSLSFRIAPARQRVDNQHDLCVDRAAGRDHAQKQYCKAIFAQQYYQVCAVTNYVVAFK